MTLKIEIFETAGPLQLCGVRMLVVSKVAIHVMRYCMFLVKGVWRRCCWSMVSIVYSIR